MNIKADAVETVPAFYIFQVKEGTAVAFDAGMLASVINEIKTLSEGARIEKVYQPSRDELILQMRSYEGGKRLLINAGGNNPRIGFSESPRENPQNPPMFCMLLRKYLNGAKLCDVRQAGFERVVYFEFQTRDEMGFECKRMLIAEIMGKYSNLIFTDGDKTIISSLKSVDFTTSSLRQVLPGMRYELPPPQDKKNPLEETKEGFFSELEAKFGDKPTDKFIVSSYLGISAAVAREMVYRATGDTDTFLVECSRDRLWESFSEIVGMIKNNSYEPCIVYKGETPIEYAFCRLTQYGEGALKEIDSPGHLLDVFYDSRDRETRVKQFASDLLKILGNAQSRITKKLEIQRSELAECEKGEEYKKLGDIITANMYLLKRGMMEVELIDYDNMLNDGSFATCKIRLDERLSPAANAQRYYKKYNKSKSARINLTKQIEIGESEAEYINSVFDSLSRAETPTDLAEIREELYRSGYASKMKSYVKAKAPKSTIMEYRTSGGYRVLCGKNNIQNEHITFKLAEKTDYWFHAKNVPGSHVVMVCEGEEPDAKDFTEAAEIAALNSKAEGENIAVDYAFAKSIKKPAGSKPGFVIYHTNWTAYVTPNRERVEKMRIR